MLPKIKSTPKTGAGSSNSEKTKEEQQGEKGQGSWGQGMVGLIMGAFMRRL